MNHRTQFAKLSTLYILLIASLTLYGMDDQPSARKYEANENQPPNIVRLSESPDPESLETQQTNELTNGAVIPALTATIAPSTTSTSSLETQRATAHMSLQPDNRYPFHMAAAIGGQEMEQFLMQTIRSGECNPNTTDNHGRTLLHYAAANGHAKIFTFLISTHNGKQLITDTSPLDNDKQTPLSYADQYGQGTVKRAFLNNDAPAPYIMWIHEADVLAKAHHIDSGITLLQDYSEYCQASRANQPVSQPHAYRLADEFKSASVSSSSWSTVSQESAQTLSITIQVMANVIPAHQQNNAQRIGQSHQEQKDQGVAAPMNNAHAQPAYVPIVINIQPQPPQLNNFIMPHPNLNQHQNRRPPSNFLCSHWVSLSVCFILTAVILGTTLGLSAAHGKI